MEKNKSFKFVQQRADWDCVVATIAMWCQVPYEDVIARVPSAETRGQGLNSWEEEIILKHFGKNPIVLEMAWGGINGILSFPSLNDPGGGHSIYYGDNKMYDPQRGRPGKKAYGSDVSFWPGCYCIIIDLNDDYSRKCADMEIRAKMKKISDASKK